MKLYEEIILLQTHATCKWVVENVGVKPDIELTNNPGLMAAGRDPQLERAIEEILKMLEKNPPFWPKVPDLPSKKK